ncbi:MAG: DUF1385 domain-containing protein [Anaerolineae bacterium]|nr:DUF1385 domain-containing protein [Anaerolineae bacterium]
MTGQSEERKTLGWNYGGQALFEGILMRGPHVAAVAVRRPDGTIDVKTQNLGKLYTGALSKIPFVRGLPMLWDSLGLGMKALFYSAEVAGQAEDPNFSLQGAAGIGMGAFSMLLGVGLFMLLPSFIAGLLVTGERALLFNVLEGAIRLALLVGYMAAVGQMPEIRRVFAYHGAEHKTINAHEAGAPLTVEGIRPFTTAHPRCGTAFLLIVVLISILVFAPLGKPALLIRLASRLLLIPVISGIAYELLRFTGKHAENRLVRILIAPNLALQRLTTREPDDSMLEVALTSLKAVLAGEAALQG